MVCLCVINIYVVVGLHSRFGLLWNNCLSFGECVVG